MGLIRKLSSISTLGAIDLRSDKERIARSTKANVAATKKQTKVLKEQLKLQRQLND